ncbi:galactose-1-phosphate uridyltransferase [Paenibacillus popilliae ATCC 14706]|uniref:Galactose-1-phosphate uridyltransferase n=1 Tax=Paenibacillus popilliae ATCC 14706 TaxID=1212764 RepID=M9M143_PAEPP|nr:galactose-1-phosphate uridyltransferase [Paenibacillus popilliae ATCC 14706]
MPADFAASLDSSPSAPACPVDDGNSFIANALAALNSVAPSTGSAPFGLAAAKPAGLPAAMAAASQIEAHFIPICCLIVYNIPFLPIGSC